MGNPLFTFIGQGAYLLLLLSFLNLSKKWLHGLALAGSALAILYCFLAEKEPLWVPLVWNSAFAFINAILLLPAFFGKLGKNKEKREKLDPMEEMLKRSSFSHFPDKALIDFVRFGIEGTVNKGEQILKAGDPLSEFFCLLEGTASAYSAKVKQDDFVPGKLIGEGLLLGQTTTPSSVVANTNVKMLAWTMDAVNQWVGKDTKRLSMLQAVVGAQIVDRTLTQARKAKTQGNKETAV